eukprot:6214485-Pleurochrysis_carterae.AAC.1
MHAHGQGATACINVGDYILVRHVSADFTKNRRKHGYPAQQRFRVVRVLPAADAVQIDPAAGTGTQPFLRMRLCTNASQDWWVVDDGSSAAGRFGQPGSSVTDVHG